MDVFTRLIRAWKPISQHLSHSLTSNRLKRHCPTASLRSIISHHKHPLKNQIFPLTFYFIYDILKIHCVRSPRLSKLKQPTEAIDSQNRRSYTFRGNFFRGQLHPQKTPLNPYGNWVYAYIPKIAKKRKKLPFGNFLGRLVTFLRQNCIGILSAKNIK